MGLLDKLKWFTAWNCKYDNDDGGVGVGGGGDCSSSSVVVS